MPKNEVLAISWFTRAAREGIYVAMLNLANCRKAGLGARKDSRESDRRSARAAGILLLDMAAKN